MSRKVVRLQLPKKTQLTISENALITGPALVLDFRKAYRARQARLKALALARANFLKNL